MSPRATTGLDFAPSQGRRHEYAGIPQIENLAKLLAQQPHACSEVIRTWNALRPNMSDHGLSKRLSDPLKFVYFRGQQGLKQRIVDALGELSDLYAQNVAEGEDSNRLSQDMRSALCEEVTFELLKQASGYEKIVRDAWAYYDGRKHKVLTDNSTNLDFARSSRLYGVLFWEVFECKQNPPDFFAPYRDRNHPDPRAKGRWMRSQVRLALEILHIGGSNVAIWIVCYRPQVQIDARMRSIGEKPPRIAIYSLNDALKMLPVLQHCP